MGFIICSIILGVIFIVLFLVLDIGRYFNKANFTGKEKAKYVILISLDGLYEKDFDIVKNMPAFQQLLDNGVYSTVVNSIYPTLTYVVHTSMITGNYPNKHGVIHNHRLQPGVLEKNQSWYWYRDEISGDTLYDRLAKENMITASLFWPVSGKAKINYNLPEILALEGENQTFKILKAGSPIFLLTQELKNKKYRRGAEQPYLDNFATKIAVDTIKFKRPNLLMLHLVSLDSFRHEFGVKSKEAIDALGNYNDSIEEIIKATKDAGTYEDTVFVITSDHGLVDVNNIVYINNLFYRDGLIKVENGQVIDFQAYCQSTGLGAYIYIKNNNKSIEKRARNILQKAMDDGSYGISKIYSKKEIKELNGDKVYSFALEAKEGYAFKDEITAEDIKKQVSTGRKYATHGYAPTREGYKNVLIVAGNNIKNNENIGALETVDIAPTIASILGINDYHCDGKNIIDRLIVKE